MSILKTNKYQLIVDSENIAEAEKTNYNY